MHERQGGCLCGAVRYTLKAEPRAVTLCHCTHCKKQSGSLYSFNLVIKEADYAQQGDTSVYVDHGDSGHPVYRHFCRNCGSPILAKIAAAPGKVVVKGGTLDDPAGLQPQAEIYSDHAAPWLAPVAGAARMARDR